VYKIDDFCNYFALHFPLTESITKTSSPFFLNALAFQNLATIAKTGTSIHTLAYYLPQLETVTKTSSSTIGEALNFFKSQIISKTSVAIPQVEVGIWAYAISHTETLGKTSQLFTILPTILVPAVTNFPLVLGMFASILAICGVSLTLIRKRKDEDED
jgi:ABC-type tungstate transport system substrate-binding protein